MTGEPVGSGDGSPGEPLIEVLEHGPYRVTGEIAVTDVDGRTLRHGGTWHLCRCGGSRRKPFCDATHGLKGFDGAETAGHDDGAGGRDAEPVERPAPPTVSPVADGPYRVTGGVRVVGADGRAYEVRARQTLCRCGQSERKPFCDGSHWYAGFRDPVPADEEVSVPTVCEALGGYDALLRLTTAFYAGILGEPDPVLEPLFRGMDPDHPAHVATWLAETFGGPRRYTTEHGGYEHMVAAHRDRGLTEEQRQAWLGRLLRTADEVGLTTDLDVRSAFVAYLEWGTRIAVFNSQPGAHVIEHGPVPSWGWGESTPYVPSPWDAPDAARRGRERYAAEQAGATDPE